MITIPKTNPNFPPNHYDLISVSNGCGNKFTAETLGISVDGEFGPACAGHDWDWSKYSILTEEEGNDKFYDKMSKIIKDGDYNFLEEIGLELQKQLYHGLVDTIGHPSYNEYDRYAIPPSLIATHKHERLKDIECVQIKILISDNTYLLRWYTREEAFIDGLI